MAKISEIDRRSQQALINDQNFIESTNQWLGKLDSDFLNHKMSCQSSFDKCNSKFREHQTIAEIHDDHIDTIHGMCEKLTNDCRDRYNRLEININNSFKHFSARIAFLEDNLSVVDQNFSHLKTINSELDRIESLILSESNRINQNMDAKDDSIKRHILGLPSEIPDMKSFISDRFSAFQIDFQGVLQEMKTLKNDVFCMRKHIEDLYTQIDRIRAGNK